MRPSDKRFLISSARTTAYTIAGFVLLLAIASFLKSRLGI